MKDTDCVRFLQGTLPRLQLRWPGFRKVRKQVCKRVGRRVTALGLADVAAYADYLSTHPDEWPVLDSLCRISISRFFRDRGLFEALRDSVLPAIADAAQRRGNTAVRVWSAGCASGEEPYSVQLLWAICLAEQFPDLELQITATDADATLLERAARGIYPRGSLKELPPVWIVDGFEECPGGLRLRPAYRENVIFERQDIRHVCPDGPFDLILCRNLVFTYFDAGLQRAVLAQLAAHLRVGGYLIIGRHEALPAEAAGFEIAAPAMPFYRRTAQAVSAAA